MRPISSSFYADLPLSAGVRDIRVLVIEPGHIQTPLNVSIKIIDLDDPKRATYTALSYTWGNQNRTKAIFRREEEVPVTPNLFNALQHLRSPSHPLTIWADAVCINQEDDAERSSQVAMMDDIYRKCEIVHIWLGCPERPLAAHHSPFALVEHFLDNKHFFELPGYWWDGNTASWKCDTQDPDFRSMMDAFMLIHNSAWWNRSWTAQEAILPKVALFRYGDWTMPLEDFWTCQLNRMRHLGNPCCIVAYQAVGNTPPRVSMDHVMGGVDCVKLVQDANSPYKTLLDVYRKFANRKCFDPHDKIYSLLGFLRPEMPKIQPDYTRPVGEIYLETFCMMIRERKGNLSTLLGEGFNSGKLGLPSWVPDFSGTYGAPQYILTRSLDAYPLFSASGDRSGKLEIVDKKSLQVAGICIDKIEARSKLIHSAWAPNPGEILEDWRRTCRRQGINISTTSRDKAFSLLLTGEMVEDLLTTKYHRLLEDDPDLLTDSQWQRYMALESDGSSLSRAYRITVGCMVDRKTLVVTSRGFIGLSLSNVVI
ncbi:hypothetical protein VMCG_07014 [Cytospora schulzeri]|uniref:Heterokaryon incompatibility domain-containing protein n=1 Tax=Cytospora schulzeri TaxID=448051 RepID=A0A423W407_9PEZI|nr:hypothetical protein VMCG_07014 [Valsa malicola]